MRGANTCKMALKGVFFQQHYRLKDVELKCFQVGYFVCDFVNLYIAFFSLYNSLSSYMLKQ